MDSVIFFSVIGFVLELSLFSMRVNISRKQLLFPYYHGCLQEFVKKNHFVSSMTNLGFINSSCKSSLLFDFIPI
jgi:hypothetical protein